VGGANENLAVKLLTPPAGENAKIEDKGEELWKLKMGALDSIVSQYGRQENN